MNQRSSELYDALRKTLFLIIGLVILLWFLEAIIGVLLLFLFAVVFAIILNAPVTWLEQQKVPRLVAVAIVFLVIAAAVALLVWLVLPRLSNEIETLLDNLPDYYAAFRRRLASFLHNYPELEQDLRLDAATLGEILPPFSALLGGIGFFSFSLIGWLALGLVLLSVVVYMVANPEPVVRTYLQVLPPAARDSGTRALARSSRMIIGWMWSNVIAGVIDAAAVAVFLSLMGIPGAALWSVLAFFAELVPLLGLYLMAIPPVLVTLSIDPLRALWVALFYLVLNEIMGKFIMPRVRASTMHVHPVFTLFAILALGSAFGLLGVLLAAPITAFTKAAYEEFYLARQPEDPQLGERVQTILNAFDAEDG